MAFRPFDADAHRRVLERMLLIRRFEEALVAMSAQKRFRSHYHLYIGQEATAAAAMESLRPDDRLVTTHRNHGHILARGADPGRAFAEILGRATGLNGGRAGTLHMSDPERGFLSTSSVVGGCIGLATGGAFAVKRRGAGGVSVGFFGDASLEEGVSFECMNLAALWKLPIVFLCENNGAGATGSSQGGFPSSLIAAPRLTGIPASLGIPTDSIDGRDADAVHEAFSHAVERCRCGDGPAFIEAVTRRWEGSKPMWPELSTGVTDLAMVWDAARIPGRYEAWYRREDPVLVLARRLLESQRLSREELLAIDAQVSARIEAARRFALESPMPDRSTAFEHVFA